MLGHVDIDAASCKKAQIKIRNIQTKNNWHDHVPISHSLQNPFSPFIRISIHHFRVYNNFNNAVFVLWDPIMGTHDLTRSLKIIFCTMIEDLNDKMYYVETNSARLQIVKNNISSILCNKTLYLLCDISKMVNLLKILLQNEIINNLAHIYLVNNF